jgi:hypothetical protein
MAKLFIFAIGGTGTRVMKALSMLMAAGVKISNTDTIVPIIIDPDSANGDLTRTTDILQLYRSIHTRTVCNKSHFFKIPIRSLDDMQEGATVPGEFRYEIDGIKEDNLFRDFIGYSGLERNTRAFTSLLFSKDNLDADMEIGFKGNPNIGSVVLNKFRDSSYFREFAQSFGENDRVFIVSSIFGGTGAAGFPTILKNIRGAQPSTPNHMNLQRARIGAVSVMPYFSINDIDRTTVIDSNTFISKTKAALHYYSRNVSGNRSVNALYYIGDQFANNRIDGADGAAEQKNSAHFVELASAMSIIDFMEKTDEELVMSGNSCLNPVYLEYGLKSETNTIEFKHLGNVSYDLLSKSLTQYTLFEYFLRNCLDETSDKVYATNGNNKLLRSALDRRFMGDLERFNKHYRDWLSELSRSSVSFSPINRDVKKEDILNIVTGIPERVNRLNILERRGIEAYLEELARVDEKEKYDTLGDSQKKLLATFAHATQNVIKKKINI